MKLGKFGEGYCSGTATISRNGIGIADARVHPFSGFLSVAFRVFPWPISILALVLRSVAFRVFPWLTGLFDFAVNCEQG